MGVVVHFSCSLAGRCEERCGCVGGGATWQSHDVRDEAQTLCRGILVASEDQWPHCFEHVLVKGSRKFSDTKVGSPPAPGKSGSTEYQGVDVRSCQRRNTRRGGQLIYTPTTELYPTEHYV